MTVKAIVTRRERRDPGSNCRLAKIALATVLRHLPLYVIIQRRNEDCLRKEISRVVCAFPSGGGVHAKFRQLSLLKDFIYFRRQLLEEKFLCLAGRAHDIWPSILFQNMTYELGKYFQKYFTASYFAKQLSDRVAISS